MQNAELVNLTPEQIQLKVRTREMFINSLLRKQYLLPPTNSNVLSNEFMQKVLGQKAWLPTTYDAHIRNCVEPPPKDTLLTAVLSAITASIQSDSDQDRKLTTCLHFKNKDVPVKYLLQILACLQPDHEYFRPDYRPPAKQSIKPTAHQATISAPAGFFDDLPDNLKGAKLGRKLRIVEPRETKLRRKHAQHLKQLDAQQRRANLLEQEIRKLDQKKQANLEEVMQQKQNMMAALGGNREHKTMFSGRPQSKVKPASAQRGKTVLSEKASPSKPKTLLQQDDEEEKHPGQAAMTSGNLAPPFSNIPPMQNPSVFAREISAANNLPAQAFNQGNMVLQQPDVISQGSDKSMMSARYARKIKRNRTNSVASASGQAAGNTRLNMEMIPEDQNLEQAASASESIDSSVLATFQPGFSTKPQNTVMDGQQP